MPGRQARAGTEHHIPRSSAVTSLTYKSFCPDIQPRQFFICRNVSGQYDAYSAERLLHRSSMKHKTILWRVESNRNGRGKIQRSQVKSRRISLGTWQVKLAATQYYFLVGKKETFLFPETEAIICWNFWSSRLNKCISESLLKAGGGFISLSSGRLLLNAIIFADLTEVCT